MIALARNVFWLRLVEVVVLAAILLISWNVARASSPRVLYAGQEILIRGEGFCTDRDAAVQVAAAYTTFDGAASAKAYQAMGTVDRCGQADPAMARVGNRIYHGTMSVIEIVGSNGHVVCYLVTNLEWKSALET